MVLPLESFLRARERLAPHLGVSPCEPSIWLDAATGASVSLKLESVQPSGSFKDRGALHRLLRLDASERERGVIAASAGNHAQAVAYHARRLGIAATIVMPETSPLIKVENTRAHGAVVVLTGASYDAAYEAARRIADVDGKVFVHAFDDDDVIAGQGTIGLELLEQCPDLEVLVAPVGGGGLLAGVASVIRASRPEVRIYGVQAALVPSLHDALTGTSRDPGTTPTLADGIAVRAVCERTRASLAETVDGIVLVDEDAIASAIVFLLERQKSLAEGAGAVAVAALLEGTIPDVRGRRVAAIVSGGNIDITTLGNVVDRGLVLAGRLVRLRVRLQDRPGALAAITTEIARAKANVVAIEHERAFTHGPYSEVEVRVTLETRGRDHVEEVRAALLAIHADVSIVD